MAGERKGLVLVAVFWVVVVLLVIAVFALQNGWFDTLICLGRIEELRCKWAGRAGVETATAVLSDDFRMSDALTDLWSDNDEDFNDVELDRCWFDVRVVDEAGKLNVNTATREQLLGLPNMTEDVADAIIDWRDKDETQSALGAESGYYQNLRYSYRIRNGAFQTVRELLLVKGVTEELFCGEDTNFNGELDYNESDGDVSPPADNGDSELDRGWISYLSCYSYDKNTDALGNKKVNINEADERTLERSLQISKSYAKWIVGNRKGKGYKSIADLINDKSPKKAKKSSKESEEASPLDLETFVGIADKITVQEGDNVSPKVNINTAPREVLVALIGDDDEAQQAADGIVAYREGLFGGMESIGEVLNVDSVKVGTFKRFADHITTRSDVFTIRCFSIAERGNVAGYGLQTEAVVDRSSTPCKILYWYQGASN
ncbi:MAG: type II secretion system protein GspK [Planctomycetota bacterium]